MEDKKTLNETRFSLLKRAKSFTHAWRGIWIFIKTTHNAWLHITFFIGAIILGLFFQITNIEWILLILTGGFVLSAEAFNTAIEIDINLTSPEFHPFARDTKDVAAGAVLIASCIAGIVGLLILGKYILELF
jgi:diacylglycerol kinase